MRRKFQTALLAVLVVFLFTACGSNGKKADDAQGTNTNQPAVANSNNEPAELVVYGVSNGEEEFNNRWGNYIKEKFPNYKIQYIQNAKGKSLPELISAGQPIDIIFDSIGFTPSNLIENGFQFDITELAKKHKVDLSRFEPTFLDAVKQMGGLYGLPVNGGGLVLYYNKDIFDKFGVPYPKDGMTWDQLPDLSKKVTRTQDGVQYAGFATSVLHPMRMNALSLNIVDPKTQKAAIDNDQWKLWLQTIVLNPIVQDSDYKNFIIQRNGNMLFTDDFVKQKNLAMFVMNFGLQYAVKEFETTNWDMVSLPTFKDKPGIGSQPYPNYFFITAGSKYKDAAMEVLKYVTSDEHEMIESKKGNIPVLKNEEIKKVFGQETQFTGKNMKNAVFYNKFAAPHTKTIYDDKVIGALDANLKKVIKGDMDLNTAFTTAQEEANKAIEQMKKK